MEGGWRHVVSKKSGLKNPALRLIPKAAGLKGRRYEGESRASRA